MYTRDEWVCIVPNLRRSKVSLVINKDSNEVANETGVLFVMRKAVTKLLVKPLPVKRLTVM